MGVCACLSALPVPFINHFYQVAILFWLLLFFGGFILPSVTGIMINSVSEYQKTSANSLANICYNLVGYLPAPGLYGFILSVTGGKSSRWAMGTLMYSTIFTVGLLCYGISRKLWLEDQEETRRLSVQNMKNHTPMGSAMDKDIFHFVD